jgi:DNA-binding beta-propeller fold protein YncE
MRGRFALLATASLLVGGCGARHALLPPGCTTAVASAPRIAAVRATMLKLPASPFGVVSAADFSFVTVGGYTGLNELWVFRNHGLHLTLVRRIALPVPGVAGEALTRNGSELLIAAGSGVTVVDVRKAELPDAPAVLGSLQAVPATAQTGAVDPRSAIEVAVTPDGRYAFVSLEYAGWIAVFDLAKARAAGWKRSGLRGMIPVGLVNVGLAVSPDGRTLYATRAVRQIDQSTPREGELVVINVRRAETDPRAAVIARVHAGCDPVRVAATPDGQTVWVTARASNALLGFSASRLARSRDQALEHVVHVGEAPVGLALIDGGRRILVMNSNRFGVVGASATLAVVDGHSSKLLGTIQTGAFPREAAVTNSNSLLVTNWGSQELQALNLADLP